MQKPHFIQAIRQYVKNSQLNNKQEIIKDMDKLSETKMEGKFFVKQKFSDAMGKFPIGEINRFVYMDIDTAFQQIL